MCRQSINHLLEALLHRLNPVPRGWAIYFRPGVSSSPSNTCPGTPGNG